MTSDYFCKVMPKELTGLKGRVSALIEKGDRVKLDTEQLSELKGISAELTHTINKLYVTCPSDLGKAKGGAGKIDYWDSDHIAGGYVGG